jgi:hypothetical protein
MSIIKQPGHVGAGKIAERLNTREVGHLFTSSHQWSALHIDPLAIGIDDIINVWAGTPTLQTRQRRRRCGTEPPLVSRTIHSPS